MVQYSLLQHINGNKNNINIGIGFSLQSVGTRDCYFTL